VSLLGVSPLPRCIARRILGMHLQWNHGDQQSRANALEQSTFEASPGG
jgi:hypothetical protein